MRDNNEIIFEMTSILKMNKSIKEMSDSELDAMMKTERISLTCAPGGENNRGMEIIGRMPIKGEGFTAKDIEGLGPYFNKLMGASFGNRKAFVLDLNALSMNEYINKLLPDEDQARVLILRDWASQTMGAHGWTREVYKEIAPIRWDAEYLDPNKYRTEIVDGKEVKIRGKRMNKLARTNLCFVADREQEPAVFEGKGTIYDLKKLEYLNKGVEKLKEQIAAGLIEIGSKTKVIINVVEGNRYYDLKKTGIGFHGDTERVVVICISIGGEAYPMRWQWFKDGMPIGKAIDVKLNSGDVYIMSEKAVGADWKKKSKYTLRHSAGAKKYTSLDRWEKKRPAYEAKLKKKAEKTVKKAPKKVKTVKKAPAKVEKTVKKEPVVKDVEEYEYNIVQVPTDVVLPDEKITLGTTHIQVENNSIVAEWRGKYTTRRIAPINIGLRTPKNFDIGSLKLHDPMNWGSWEIGEKIGNMPQFNVSNNGDIVRSGLYTVRKRQAGVAPMGK